MRVPILAADAWRNRGPWNAGPCKLDHPPEIELHIGLMRPTPTTMLGGSSEQETCDMNAAAAGHRWMLPAEHKTRAEWSGDFQSR